MGGGIFISYRREDAAGEAGRLADHLTSRFGHGRVFMDIDAIEPGTDFVASLDRALTATGVVLVVIGRHWLTAVDSGGRKRLEDPADFVRREVLSALQGDGRVVPVLVQGATMPSAAELPAEMAPLAARQAMAIQHEEFSADAQRLADAIAPLVGKARGVTSQTAVLAAVGLLVLLAAGATAWRVQSVARDEQARAEVAELIRVADGQRDRGQLSDALSTLDRALSADVDTTAARTLQEDVAMQWVRELTVESGQRFGDAMVAPLAVLDRAAASASGARQGDLLAHLGWATFLRWRDGDRPLDPEGAYRRAMAVDPTNPYANAMLGHWMLSYDQAPDSLDQARRHFRTAIDAGRATGFVRSLQLSALRNLGSAEGNLETVRVMDEMRRRGESLEPRQVRDSWNIYYFALSDGASLSSTALLAALPPSEHLLTLQWAFDDYSRGDASRLLQLRYYTARLQADSGNIVAARNSLQALRNELRESPGSLAGAVDRTLNALGSRP
jgi:hypothetical protein